MFVCRGGLGSLCRGHSALCELATSEKERARWAD